MSVHHFDTRVAERVGVNAACIAYSIQYWCAQKAANEKDIHGGKAWVYNSMKAWAELLPYLSEKQIRTALDKLQKEGIIEARNLNEKQYDQTLWYAYIGLQTVVTIANRPNGQMELPKKAIASAPEGKSNCPKGQTNTNNKPNTIPNDKPVSDPAGDALEAIWASWSKLGIKRSKSKAHCLDCLKRVGKSHDLQAIVRAATMYAKATDGNYHKGLHLWLSGGFYENWMPRDMGAVVDAPADALEFCFDAYAKSGEWYGDRNGHPTPPNSPSANYPRELYEKFGIKHPKAEQAA